MSVRIQKLEEALGVRLFDRGPHEVKLTPEGRGLLPDIRDLVDMQDRMYERIQTSRVVGQVRLGVAEGYEASLLPGFLQYMQKNHADAELDITCRPSWRLQQLIDARTLDLAVVTLAEESASARRCCERIVGVVLGFAEHNAGIMRVLLGEALVGEDRALVERVGRFFERLETQLRTIVRDTGDAGLTQRSRAGASANLMVAFVIGRMHQYSASGLRRRPTEDLERQWAMIAGAVFG